MSSSIGASNGRQPRNRRLPQRLSDGSVRLYDYNPSFGSVSSTVSTPGPSANPHLLSSEHKNASTARPQFVNNITNIRELNLSVAVPLNAELDPNESQIPSPSMSSSAQPADRPLKVSNERSNSLLPKGQAPKLNGASATVITGRPPSYITARKRNAKKGKEKASEKPQEKPPRAIAYLDDVVSFHRELIKKIEEQVAANATLPIGREKKLWTDADPVTGQTVYHDFSSSDDEEDDPSTMQLPSSDPTVFLVDLHINLAASIYKRFVTDCRQHFDTQWKYMTDLLLMLNWEDLHWVDNMRRRFYGQEPTPRVPKTKIDWYNERLFLLECRERCESPNKTDYEWTMQEMEQEAEINKEDLELAKKYLSERGIPLKELGLDIQVMEEDAMIIDQGRGDDAKGKRKQ